MASKQWDLRLKDMDDRFLNISPAESQKGIKSQQKGPNSQRMFKLNPYITHGLKLAQAKRDTGRGPIVDARKARYA